MQSRPTSGDMRCDLHVHSIYSGMCTVPVVRRVCRECYAQPEALYERLKLLGMDLVTVTDHDSIDAAESLRKHPDFFVSEEATCRMPSGTEIHVGIYDISEADHLQIQRRRDDFFSLIAYLNERRLFFSINHAFSHLTGRREAADYEWFARIFPAVEVRNGTMSQVLNEAAAKFARAADAAIIAGSDAHALASAGSVWTRVPGAQSREEFLAGLRTGHAIAEGAYGSWWKLTRDVWSICGCMVKERPWTVALAPLIASVPLATLISWTRDGAFTRRWMGPALDAARRATLDREVVEWAA